MSGFNLEYIPKTQKQLEKLGACAKHEIEQAIIQDKFVFDETGNLKSVGSQFTGDFWWVRSKKYLILIHVRIEKKLILVMAIDHNRS